MSQDVPLRPRRATSVSVQSDVTRFRGLVIGTLIAAGGVGLSLATLDGGLRPQAPAALARPHARANLTCAACHTDADDPATTCASCHGNHASTRAGHAALAAAGTLRCSDCHRIHVDEAGVSFADGKIVRYAIGTEVEVSPAPGFGVEGLTTTVPIVAAAACARCHTPESPRDPLARCLVAGQAELGLRRPTVCFDEHRRFGPGGDRGRLRAWEAARRVAAGPPLPGASERTPRHRWWPVGVWFAGGLLGFVGWRAHATRAPRVTQPAPQVVPPKLLRLPQIDATTCIGCSACVDACPYDVLEMDRFVAKLARPDDCCGLTLCEQRCPNGSLQMGAGHPVEDRPAVADDLQSADVPGLYLAGDLTGLPLIRNAINQGAYAVGRIAAALRSEGPLADPTVLDLIIVGAGPAGVSASLAAKAAGLRHLVLEQASVAHSIRSFPRGKLVFDQPLSVPLIGDLWLAESTKEELLAKWLQIVASAALPITESARVTGVAAIGQLGGVPQFEVTATTPSGPITYVARRVVIAIGRRGSPQRLPVAIPEAAIDRVHYALADAGSFAGAKVVIVGLGDVAMEAAVALARQRGTEVHLVARGADFKRGKARNIAAVRRAASSGRITMHWRTQVSAVAAGTLRLAHAEEPVVLAFDALFVLIGNRPAWALLGELGLARPDRGVPRA